MTRQLRFFDEMYIGRSVIAGQSESDSDTDESGEDEKVEFITSFGGESDSENKNGLTFR